MSSKVRMRDVVDAPKFSSRMIGAKPDGGVDLLAIAVKVGYGTAGFFSSYYLTKFIMKKVKESKREHSGHKTYSVGGLQ